MDNVMNKRSLILTLAVFLLSVSLCSAGFLDDIFKGFSLNKEQGLDVDTVVSGLKEALSVGTDRAVKSVSKMDGYLGNEAIKILMPEKIQKVADVLKKVGYQEQVDSFIASMNRAAEKAAPKAASYFADSVRDMSFDDARKILDGNETAATEYFRTKTFDKLYGDFKPVISSSMNDVGATRAYKEMIGKYTALPFMKEKSLDLDHYVTDKALNGLFLMLAEEEKKIRTDPATRTTELLKKVFSK
jgi:hypothetical protein